MKPYSKFSGKDGFIVTASATLSYDRVHAAATIAMRNKNETLELEFSERSLPALKKLGEYIDSAIQFLGTKELPFNSQPEKDLPIIKYRTFEIRNRYGYTTKWRWHGKKMYFLYCGKWEPSLHVSPETLMSSVGAIETTQDEEESK